MIVALLSFVRVGMCVLHKCYDEKRTVREDWRDLNFSLSLDFIIFSVNFVFVSFFIVFAFSFFLFLSRLYFFLV